MPILNCELLSASKRLLGCNKHVIISSSSSSGSGGDSGAVVIVKSSRVCAKRETLSS